MPLPGALFSLLVCCSLLSAQVTRPKDVRELAKGGSNALPQLQALLKNADPGIRVEAVKSIVDIGTQRSLDPLIEATADSDAEVQIRATDGLVNFYLPGYVRTGFSAKLQRVGSGIKGKFTDTNDQVIEAYVQVRPEVDRGARQTGARRRQHGIESQRSARGGHSARAGGHPGSARRHEVEERRRAL